MSPTVLRSGPFRVYFFSMEEARAHVHVSTSEGEATFWLEPDVELATSIDLKPHVVRRARRLILEREEEIKRAWHEHFSG